MARCLNRGGSVARLQRTPLPELLDEVAVAAVPTTLDRWDVRISPEASGGGNRGMERRAR